MRTALIAMIFAFAFALMACEPKAPAPVGDVEESGVTAPTGDVE